MMEDSGIIELYWQRSESAIAETAEKYGRYCYTIAYSILSNSEDADESVNDTWLGAWNSIPPNKPSTLSTFLGKITRRIALKRWRHKNAEKRGGGEIALALDELIDCIPTGQDISAELEAAELGKMIDGFLAGLPEDERNVFIRRYWHLRSVSEIGAQFGFSKSKVKSILHRTRIRLKATLKKEGIFDEC